MKESKKSRNVIVAIALVLVVGIATFLVACSGNNSNNGGETSNSSTNVEQPSKPGDDWGNLIIGWGKLNDDLSPSTEDVKDHSGVVIDTNEYLRYVESNYREPNYNGQKLTFVEVKARNGNSERLEFSVSVEEDILRLNSPNSLSATFDGDTDLFKFAFPPIYYSLTERRVLSYAEYEALSN